MKFYLPILFFIVLLMFSCGSNEGNQAENLKETNPAAEGFDAEGSDPTAISLADEVMKAMGGRANWDATRYLTWNFFDRRKLYWDKQEGDVRIESYPDSTTFLVNIFSGEGKVQKEGIEMEHPDSLSLYLDRAKSIWINDSYWLVMPFKLKDSGVTLNYIGEDTTQLGAASEVLSLTFKNVGKTPDNKYLVYVDKASHLITQWDFYTVATDSIPRFSTPWADYEKHGNLLLSGNRGRGKLTEISAPEELPESLFKAF